MNNRQRKHTQHVWSHVRPHGKPFLDSLGKSWQVLNAMGSDDEGKGRGRSATFSLVLSVGQIRRCTVRLVPAGASFLDEGEAVTPIRVHQGSLTHPPHAPALLPTSLVPCSGMRAAVCVVSGLGGEVVVRGIEKGTRHHSQVQTHASHVRRVLAREVRTHGPVKALPGHTSHITHTKVRNKAPHACGSETV